MRNTAASLLTVLMLGACSEAVLEPDPPIDCAHCEAWNQPLAPFRVFGGTFYVGTAGLSSILIDTGNGLILIDGHLVVFAPSGDVVVARASPEGFKEEARVKVSERGTYTYPSFSDGLILVRNTRDFAAISVGAAPAAPLKEEPVVARNDFERFVQRVGEAHDKRLLIDDFMLSQSSFPVVEDD